MDKRLRVLIVEDDEDDFVLARGVLDEVQGLHFDVEWAATYDAGAAEIRKNRRDVYLFDYRLGAESGLDLLKLARAVDPGVPAIMLTGQKADGVDMEALRAGASDYLVKGQFDSELLGRSIRYSLERKRVEQALRASEERYRDLLENANDMVFTYDLRGDLTSVNAAMAAITGYSREELVGVNLAKLLSPASIATFEEIKVRKVSEEHTGSYEMEVLKKNGEIVSIEVNDRIVAAGPDTVEFQAIGRDITERRAAERTLREYALEIENRNAELAAALKALRGKWSQRRAQEYGGLEEFLPRC